MKLDDFKGTYEPCKKFFFFANWHLSTIKETLIKNNHVFGLAYPVVLFYQCI